MTERLYPGAMSPEDFESGHYAHLGQAEAARIAADILAEPAPATRPAHKFLHRSAERSGSTTHSDPHQGRW